MQLPNGRWIWYWGETLVTYVIKDDPVHVPFSSVTIPFVVDRAIIVTDIFAL